MAGLALGGRSTSVPSSRARRGVIALAALVVGALGLVLVSVPVAVPAVANNGDPDFCGGAITSESAPPKQINLVLDDSGSMFVEPDGGLLDRWSKAKYALEVFAALMGPNDTLRVYRLSDFVNASDSKSPELELMGTQSRSDRVEQIHSMDLLGKGTPFLAVEVAAEDLQESTADDKWLVVITDGKFDLGRGQSLEEAELNQRTKTLVEQTQQEQKPINVAYLAIGQGIPVLTENRTLGIYSEQANDDQQLLLKMNDLADRVFGRDAENLPASGRWDFGSDNVDMEQMIVFAQGAGVQIGATAQTEAGPVEASDIVNVKWTTNPDVTRGGVPIRAVPDESLEGQVAFFENVARGPIQFDISGARPDVPVRVFYKPQVSLGYKLFNANGSEVQEAEPVAGTYRVDYGFVDSECEFVDSPLLGDQIIEYVGITQDGQVIDEGFESGSTVDLPKGPVTFALEGSYLDGVRVQNPDLLRTFLPPPLPSEMSVGEVSYAVSELGEFPAEADQIPIAFSIIDDGVSRAPTEEEWASLDPATFTVESESNLEFEVQKKKDPGQLSLLVRAPEGDVYKATTGPIEANVRGSYLPGQTSNAAEATVPLTVRNDLSRWDRFLHWLKTDGWKWLLALLLLILLIGYLTKKRFSKRIKKRPSITGTPKSVGVTAIEDRGKFQAGGIRRFLPFVANTATLSYVPPGTVGFRAMKLKAGPGKSMIVTNWKEIAEKDNVEINGTPLNSETRRPPKLSASGTVMASTPQMTYELTPSN